MLTPSNVEQFLRDGFFIDRGAFTPAECDVLRHSARQVQEKTRNTLPSGTRFWFGGADNRASIPEDLRPLATWGVNEITRPELFDPALVNVFAHPNVHQAMHALLGPEPRAWGIKLLWTPKVVGYDLEWHRDLESALYDVVHRKPAAQDHVQFNSALNFDDCFLVVPGSHRRPLTEREWEAVRYNPTASLSGEVTTALQPGDILYMDAHTLHRGRSSTQGDRLTLHYSAQAQWVPLKAWGTPEHFAWITSGSFRESLLPYARPLYERLQTAARSEDAAEHIRKAADVEMA